MPTASASVSASAVSGGQASVTFTASTNPGKPSGNYVATSSPGSITGSAAASPITVTGLTIGTNYTFTVVKQSGSGISSVSSSSSNSIGAFTTPGAPTIALARLSSQTLRITLSTAAAANNSTITSYEYRIKAGAGSYGSYVTLSGLSGPWDIGSLTNGTTYTVQVRAVNAGGGGTGSNEPSAVPYTVPDAPTLTITNGCDTVDWSWSPNGDGGSAITGYQYDLLIDGTLVTVVSPAGTDYPGSINNDKNTSTYVLRARAVNAAGSSGNASAGSTPWVLSSYRAGTVPYGSCGTQATSTAVYTRSGCPDRDGATTYGAISTNACGGSGWALQTGYGGTVTASDGGTYAWNSTYGISVRTDYTDCGSCYAIAGNIYKCDSTYCFVRTGCQYVCF
jgi:hypothetical protein